MQNLLEITEQTIINQRLRDLYGLHPAVNLPRFRVSWSDDCREKRFGEFEDYYGEIFLRKVKEVREVQKYPWLDGQWIVERLIPNYHSDVIVDTNYSYECIRAFPKGLPLEWRAVELVLVWIYNGPVQPKTQKECDYQESKKLEQTKKEEREKYDNFNVLETCFDDGSAVSLSGLEIPKASEEKVENNG